MPLKKIVHDVAQTIAEKTAPDYVPPPPKREPLTMADQHRLVRVKANLDVSIKKLAIIENFLLTTNKDIRCKIEHFDLPAVVKQIKQARAELKAHITSIDAVLKP